MLIVCFHVLELLLDDAAMPRGMQVPEVGGGWGVGEQQGAPSVGQSPFYVPPLLQDTALGQVSFSILGSFGAALQVVLILYPLCRHWGLCCRVPPPPHTHCCPPPPPAVPSVLSLTPPRSYLMLSSVVGFYSSPLFTRLLPERQDTPLTKVRPPSPPP